MQNCIIYCRVSTVEQTKGYSLASQKEDCKRFAAENDYNILKTYMEEGESAKTVSRTQLQLLLNFVEENSERVDALVLYKLDRLSRNLLDQKLIMRDFMGKKIQILSVTEPNRNDAAGKLFRNIQGAFAQYFNDNLSDLTKRGIKRAVEEGKWCWMAPFGYTKEERDGEKYLIPHPEDARKVKKAFQMTADGYSRKEVAEYIGRPRQSVSYMLRNRAYTGEIVSKANDVPVKGRFKALISKALFYKVQKTNTKKSKHVKINDDFPLRGLVKCAGCGKLLRSGWATGRSGKKYPYYMCSGHINVRKEKLEKQFLDILDNMALAPPAYNKLKQIFIEEYKQMYKEQLEVRREIKRKIKTNEKRLERMEDLLIDGTLTREIFLRRRDNTESKLLAHKADLNEITIDEADRDIVLEEVKSLIVSPRETWEALSTRRKIQFHKALFSSKLEYDGEKYLNTPISPIFRILQKKNGKNAKMGSSSVVNLNKIYYSEIPKLKRVLDEHYGF